MESLSKFVLSGALLLTALCLCSGALPPGFRVCSRNDPELSACIVETVKQLQPLLKTGEIAENFTIVPLEPLVLDNIKINRGPEFKAQFSNLKISGPSNFILEKLKASVKENVSIDFIIKLPRLDFVGNYNLNIKLLVLAISGKGVVHGAFNDTRAKIRMRGVKYQKDGETHIKFNDFTVKAKTGAAKLKLDNLFNGDPVLSQVGNDLINNNIDLFLSEIVPGLEKNLAVIFKDITNDVMARGTFDEFFPESLPAVAGKANVSQPEETSERNGEIDFVEEVL